MKKYQPLVGPLASQSANQQHMYAITVRDVCFCYAFSFPFFPFDCGYCISESPIRDGPAACHFFGETQQQ